MSPPADGAIQAAWCDVVIATIAAARPCAWVVSPGSRSTPLVLALIRAGVAAQVIIDERSAGFYALGAARASGQPAVLLCTSGSAATHYAPAVVEACEAELPLIIVTADRPPELRDCGASQTIDQRELFGRFTRDAVELPTAGADLGALRGVARRIAQAVRLARGPRPGPVQLNVPLRKPLEPTPVYDVATQAVVDAARALAAAPPVEAPPRLVAAEAEVAALAAAIAAHPDGVMVVGAGVAPHAHDALHALAARASYPLLAEAISGLGRGLPHPDLTCAAASGLKPSLVITVGAEPVSLHLARLPGTRWALATRTQDPHNQGGHTVCGAPDDTAVRVAAALPAALSEARQPWRDAWTRAATRAADAIATHLRSTQPGHELGDDELAIMATLVAHLPADSQLQVSNSLPARGLDGVTWPAAGPRLLSQRGAAGIDGMIASAIGATHTGRPTLLLLGDVAFAHDVGSLALARTAQAPLVIAVLDNGGGQIFAGLPVATALEPEAMRAWFLTPPGLDPVALARAHGLPACRATRADLADVLATAWAHGGVSLVHLPVAPTSAHAVRQALLRAVTEP